MAGKPQFMSLASLPPRERNSILNTPYTPTPENSLPTSKLVLSHKLAKSWTTFTSTKSHSSQSTEATEEFHGVSLGLFQVDIYMKQSFLPNSW